MLRTVGLLAISLALALPLAARAQLPQHAPLPPGPPACAPYEDENGPLLIGDPRLDGSGGCASLGWIASLEADILKPVIHSRMEAPVVLGTIQHGLQNGGQVPPDANQVSLPAAQLGWNVMPRVELGYRFGQGAGELLIGYRFLTVSGSDTSPAFDALGPATLRTHLSIHAIDLDYANHEYSLGPLWDMKWRAGVRIANVYSDSRAQGGLVGERTTDFFMGAGPHVGLDVRRKLQGPFAAFGRVDASAPIGSVAETFEQTRRTAGPNYAQTRLVSPGPLTTLNIQAGLNWQPQPNLGVTAGYSLENWWDLVTFYGQHRGETIVLQGFFVRGEWKY